VFLEISPLLSNGNLGPQCRESSQGVRNWSLVHSWLSECAKHHDQCNKTIQSSPWWPTRLLQIQEQDSSGLRLIETTESAPKGPYLTLSHRWGKAQFKKLTAKTLDDLKAGISVAILPKTFQDAISVARRLQVRYLWIDSLCIMQDSSEDWNREASQMSLVYQHGYCNIAATGALDSTAGLFLDGSAPLQTPCRVELPMWGDPQGREVSYVLDPDLWRNRIDNAPLITRAWVV
jgi:hypothetical protein